MAPDIRFPDLDLLHCCTYKNSFFFCNQNPGRDTQHWEQLDAMSMFNVNKQTNRQTNKTHKHTNTQAVLAARVNRPCQKKGRSLLFLWFLVFGVWFVLVGRWVSVSLTHTTTSLCFILGPRYEGKLTSLVISKDE